MIKLKGWKAVAFGYIPWVVGLVKMAIWATGWLQDVTE